MAIPMMVPQQNSKASNAIVAPPNPCTPSDIVLAEVDAVRIDVAGIERQISHSLVNKVRKLVE